MNKKSLYCLIPLVAVCLSACTRPEVIEIKPNETAFLIQMDGNSKTQKAFMSEEYLADNKVASKRVVIPYVGVPGGGFTQKVLAAKLITVDRTPVTREWTRSEKTGTSSSNQAISVESRESIDFTVGVVLTASIPEQTAAKFLYHYAGTPLSVIADTNIRGFVQAALSREFGGRDLDAARKEKAAIFIKVYEETRAAFSVKGIAIDNLGYSEGMSYADPSIQRAINANFEAAMAVQKAEQKVKEAYQLRLAAEEFAKAKDASVARIELDIRQLQAQAQIESVRKWDGRLPANIVPQGSGLLFGLDKAVAK
ncbi:MAG: SPFH domain-containing protein [Pseudomonadota bacterium]